MKQKISGFHLDNENHWVAELVCGHAQHVRHDPPWMERPWVLSDPGRASRLGTELNCVRCDEAGRAVAKIILAEAKTSISQAFEDSGIQGLCTEGRIEAAIGSLDMLPVETLIEKALQMNEGTKG